MIDDRMTEPGRHPQALPTSPGPVLITILHFVIAPHSFSISGRWVCAAAVSVSTLIILIVRFVRRARRLLALGADCAISALRGILRGLV